MSSELQPQAGGAGSPEVVHVVYGGMSGIRLVASGMTEGMRAYGFGSSIILYQRDELSDADLSAWDSAHSLHCVTKEPGLDLSGLKLIRGLIAQLRPRVVVFHTAVPAVLLTLTSPWRLGRRTRVLVNHSPRNVIRRSHKLFNLLSIFLMSAVVKVGPNSFPAADSLIGRARSSKIHTIPNGIDVPDHPIYRGPPTDEDAFRVGMAGRMVPVKDFDTLIRAVHDFNSDPHSVARCQLVVAGTGPDAERICELGARLLGSDFSFLGQLDQRDMPSFFSSIHAYVHSTLAESDVSTTVLQSLALGLPTVVSAAPGIREILMEHDGDVARLFAPGRAQELTCILRQIYEDPDHCRRLSANGRDFVVSQFSSEIMARNYLSLFASLDARFSA